MSQARQHNRFDRPLRMFWAVLLAPVGVATGELFVQSGRLGSDLLSVVGALAFAGALGFPLALLVLLSIFLWQQKTQDFGSRSHQRKWGEKSVGWWLVSLTAIGLGWQVSNEFVVLLRDRPSDSFNSLLQVLRAALFLTLPVALFFAARVNRFILARMQASPGLASWLAKSIASFYFGLALWHFCQGPYIAYLGALFPVLLCCLSGGVFFLWFERLQVRRLWVHALSVGIILVGGAWGSSNLGSRALLLHDTRVFPSVRRILTASADLDGDGEVSSLWGGEDCNDDDATVASFRPERPGNGVDDNCWGGDAETKTQEPAESEKASDPKLLPVIFVTADTVRADHLELNGYERDTMPFMTHYAKQSRFWQRAYAPSNHTSFSVLSLFSGQSPEFLVQDPKVLDQGARRYTQWFPKTLAQHGYRTIAINPARFLPGDIRAQDIHFDSVEIGPHDYAEKNRGTQAKQIVDLSLQTIARHQQQNPQQPLFLWLHIPDPHARHESHEHFPGHREIDAYDNELRWTDLQLARLISSLHERFGDDFVYVFTSDHGDEFGERGAWGHGFSLYESEIRVPLLIRAPGLLPGVEKKPVSLLSVSATIYELLGISPGYRPSHSSLLSKKHSDEPIIAACPFFWSEKRMEVALVEEQWKLIWNRQESSYLLFDLKNDPKERQNLVERNAEQFKEMREEMLQALEHAQ